MTKWPQMPLGELGANVRHACVGGPFGSELTTKDYVNEPGIPVIRGSNLGEDGFIDEGFVYVSEVKAQELQYNQAYPGDITFTQRGTIGQVALIPATAKHKRYVLSQSQMKLTPDRSRVDPDFLVHYFRSPSVLSFLKQNTLATGVPHINLSILRRVPVPLPSLAEQRRIANILDMADATRRKRKEAVTLTEELIRSAFLEMFGVPVTNPMGWPIKPLGELADVNRGKFSPRPRNDPRFYGGISPFIQTGDLRNTTGYLREWRQTLNKDGCSVSRGFSRGTVAMAIAANIGDTAIVDFDFYCPDSVVGIVVRDTFMTREYLERMLRFFQPKLTAEAPETAQKNINLETLRPLLVPVPPLSLQQYFGEFYHRSYVLIEGMKRSLLEIEMLWDALMQRAFVGRLGGSGEYVDRA